MQKLHKIKALQIFVLFLVIDDIESILCKFCLLKIFGTHLGARIFLKLRLIDLCIFTSCFFFSCNFGGCKNLQSSQILDCKCAPRCSPKKLGKAMPIHKWFENETEKSREFQSNLSTFSACNFQLEIFDYHYPNNHSKNSFFVLLRKFELLPRVFVFFL